MKSARIALLSIAIALSGCVIVPADHWYGGRYWDYHHHDWDRDGWGDYRYWHRDWDRDRNWDWR